MKHQKRLFGFLVCAPTKPHILRLLRMSLPRLWTTSRQRSCSCKTESASKAHSTRTSLALTDIYLVYPFIHSPKCLTQVLIGASQTVPGIVRQHISESTELLHELRHSNKRKQRHALNELEFTSLLSEAGSPGFSRPKQLPGFQMEESNLERSLELEPVTMPTALDTQAWLESSDFAVETTKWRTLIELPDELTARM